MRCKNCLLLLIFSVIFILINSCKKDDLSESGKRILGKYDVEQYLIGGSDSTAALRSKPCYGRITFANDGELYGNRDVDTCSFDGSYALSNNDKDITFIIQGRFPEMAPIGVNANITWQIKELTDKQMTFETVYNGKLCKLRLK